jgi:O-antigen/teichoic acid export membrane protein
LVNPKRLTSRIGRGFRKAGDPGLARDTGWSLAFEFTALAVTTVAFTLLGRTLGATGYGSYAALYAIVAPLGTLAASGVTLTLLQFGIREREHLESITRSCISMTMGIGLMLSVIGVLIASRVVPELDLLTTSSFFVAEFVSYPLIGICATATLVGADYPSSVRVKLQPLIARLAMIVIMFAVGGLTVRSLGVGYLILTTVLASLRLFALRRRFDVSVKPGRVSTAHFRTSAHYAGGNTGLSIQNDGDKAVLASFRFQRDTGLYSAAYRIVQMGLLPLTSFVSVTHQRFLQDDRVQGQQLRRATQFAAITTAFGLTFVAGIMVFAPVIPSILGHEFDDSVVMMRVLAPMVVLRGLTSFPLNGLMGLGKTGVRSLLLLTSAGVSMLLYVSLIPSLQWKGAAIGTLAGETFLAAVSWWALVHYQRKANESLADKRTSETPRAVVPQPA